MKAVAYKPLSITKDEEMVKELDPKKAKLLLEFDSFDEVLNLYLALGKQQDELFKHAQKNHVLSLENDYEYGQAMYERKAEEQRVLGLQFKALREKLDKVFWCHGIKGYGLYGGVSE